MATTKAPPAPRTGLAVALLVGVAVAAVVGVYSRVHEPSGRPAFLLGFSSVFALKSWMTTVAVLFVVVQLLSALWMWGRLPGAGSAPGWLSSVHRWSGAVAFVISLPVALQCVWALGFETTTPRVILHGAFGCLFYGAYAAKMLGLRLHGLPAWALPVLGGTVFTLFVLVWGTSALWFFTSSDDPLF